MRVCVKRLMVNVLNAAFPQEFGLEIVYEYNGCFASKFRFDFLC